MFFWMLLFDVFAATRISFHLVVALCVAPFLNNAFDFTLKSGLVS